MDEPHAAEVETNIPGTPRRGTRSQRSDQMFVPAAAAVDAARGQTVAASETPLVTSRSLGPLLRLASLHFKLESCQPTGSWLDRGAARIVGRGQGPVLGVVGTGPLSLALAVQCARAGRQLIVLFPATSNSGFGWLESLGARIVAVDADEQTLRGSAPSMLAQVGGQYVGSDDPDFQAGFCDLLTELPSVEAAGSVLALGSLTGHEADWLVEAARERQAAVSFPLDGMEPHNERRVHAVVGSPVETAGPANISGGVIWQPVSVREAAAAQRLLAHEEGIVSSLIGAVGLAALIRAVQNDRRLALRERRLPRELSAVVVVTRDLAGADGPMLAAGGPPTRTVSLAEAQAGLARLLVSDGVARAHDGG